LLDLKREGLTCDMAILLNRIQRPAFLVAVCCVWWLNAAFGGPVQALGGPKKTVLVLYGEEQLFIPANRVSEQGLMAALLSVPEISANMS
jgi:hypothetical protein